ncbi:hypothetical protein [Mycolicibacterium pulveris]|uniref:hypothetical protein n=1 Tax=Mycolicibacterium pulveris TaxID=36813 RepID=UPI003CEFCB9D
MTRQVPARLRLRRRLLLFSAPVAVVAVLAVVKMLSVVFAGHAAQSHFDARDVDALRNDVSILSIVNVIEPAKAPFAAGTLAVLQNRLEDADARFSEALARTDAGQSCPVRVNLALVRERQGDIEAWEGRPDAARQRYDSAAQLVADAPQGCFADNTDPDLERRAVREDTAARLAAKIAGLTAPPEPPPPPASAPPPPPAAVVAPGAPEPDAERPPLLLHPETGDPIDRLRQLLRDAAG